MKKTVSIFDDPIVEDVLKQLFDKLLNESGRGAVLIGTAYVEEQLTCLIEKILPSREKKYLSRLFNYPGPLCSFSAKIELAYAFRVIPKNMFDSLNALRKIRNDAAHSSTKFSLREIGDRLDKVFEFGDGFPVMIHNISTESMVKWKFDTIKEILLSRSTSEDLVEDEILEKFKDPETINLLEDQLPQWKLVFGLTIFCSLLIYYSGRTAKSIQGINIWSQLLDKLDVKEKNDLP